MIGILTTSNDYRGVINQNEQLYEAITKNFKNFYIIDLNKLLILKTKKKKIFSKTKNIKYFEPKNFGQLRKFLSKKKLIAFNGLGVNFNYYKIHYYLKKIDLTLILLLNIGYQANTIEVDYNGAKNFLNSSIFKLEKFFSKKIHRIFTLMNIFPRIDYYFDSSKSIIKHINNSKINLIEKKVPFLKISYFKNPILINSRSFDKVKDTKNISNKYITFVDSGIDCGDRIVREGKIDKKIIINYYKLIYNILYNFGKKYKKKAIFCIHPKNKNRLIKKYFPKSVIKRYQTFKYIKQSHIILFHESSAALDAILLNKTLISLKSKLLGNYLTRRTENYIKNLGLYSINLDLPFKINKKIVSKPNLTLKTKLFINNYLKADGNNYGYKKIIKVLEKIK